MAICLYIVYTILAQILLVDGEILKRDPAAVMKSVQKFLDLSPVLKYNDFLQ